jgi:hypothetical protein
MALSNLRREFAVAVGAAEAAIRINTDEIADCIRTLTEVARQYNWQLRVWDHTAGTVWYNGTPPPATESAAETKKNALADILAAQQGPPGPLQTLLNFLNEPPRPDVTHPGEVQPTILVMLNFHTMFETQRASMSSAVQHLVRDKVADHPLFQKLKGTLAQHGIGGDADTGKFLVGVMPAEAKLPPEIEPLFRVIAHELPDQEELEHIFDGIPMPTTADGKPVVTAAVRRQACRHALGLTRMQAEGVFSACVVQHGHRPDFATILPRFVWQAKSDILNKEGLVELYTGTETYDQIVGLRGLKEALSELLDPDEYDPDDPELRSRGVCLVGPPRTGKSLTAKALGNQKGRPTLLCNPGNLLGEYVGNTERNTRKFFQLVRAHAPCIVVIDEVEKVMPSPRAGAGGDNGVSQRLAGTFMTQLQDIKEDVFWVFTANSTDELHEAFLADERVDQVFYVPMPRPEQRAAGWKMYIERFFPAQVKGKKFPRHLSTSFPEVLASFRQGQPEGEVSWVDRFVAALLCLGEKEREDAIQQLSQENSQLAQEVAKAMFRDDGWTIARIKAVCRMARKRKKSLTQIARTKRSGLSTKLARAVQRLERWAADDPDVVNAETGEPHVQDEEEDEDERHAPQQANGAGKVRRSVRRLDR